MIDNKLNENNDENSLNPPPKSYRVSLRVKLFFLAIAAVGISGYIHLFLKKRRAEHAFMIDYQVRAEKPTRAFLPEIMLAEVPLNKMALLQKKQDSFILLNLWATWCPACREEMPSLELLQKKLGEKVKIVAVSVDDALDPVIEFTKVSQSSIRILWDAEKKLSALLNVVKYPETFLVDPEGRIIAQFSGPRMWASESMVEYLQRITKF